MSRIKTPTVIERMDAADRIKATTAALTDIRDRAKDHPCFDADCFERRDIDGLCTQGGDILDWTMIAILADDALQAVENDQAEP